MTLSQRLTRAGLTFILLGSVAVALPQQDGAAQAYTTNCVPGTTIRFRLTDHSDFSDNSTAILASGSTDTLITLRSTDGGATFTRLGNVPVMSSNTAIVSLNPVAATDSTGNVVATGNAQGGATVTATFTESSATEIATFDFTVPAH